MYQGKYCKKQPRKSKKSVALVVSLLLLITVTTGSTLSFLVTGDDSVSNLFDPSQVSTAVRETLIGNTKSNVCIQNTGNTDAWIRASVAVTWQNEAGNVYGQTPGETDYEINWGTGWKTGNDGFYYWPSPVAAGKQTGELIESISPKDDPPAEGYYLTVEIIASGIQSKPASVFHAQWASSGLQVNSANTDPSKWTLEVQE